MRINDMNKAIVVIQTEGKELRVVETLTVSTDNSSTGAMSTYVEGTVGYEMYKHLVA